MTVESFHDVFIKKYKLDTKDVVEYINELEATIYEKDKEIKELKDGKEKSPINENL